LPPLEVKGAALSGIEYTLPVASAQVKSCLLLAGLLADGETTVVERDPSRDHTERMLRAAGARIRVERDGSGLTLEGRPPGRRVSVERAEALEPVGITVPGDFSSAAFFVVGALIVPGSRVEITDVGLNPTRVGLLGILNRMGARIEVEEGPPASGEPRGTIVARHSPLTATRVGAGEVPLAIDELPLVSRTPRTCGVRARGTRSRANATGSRSRWRPGSRRICAARSTSATATPPRSTLRPGSRIHTRSSCPTPARTSTGCADGRAAGTDHRRRRAPSLVPRDRLWLR
jgi:hypothetical protein